PSETPLSSTSAERVEFVGLGNIGYLMARNLMRGLNRVPGAPPVLLWNRTERKAEQLVKEVGQDRARVAPDPEQIAVECDIVITNLANDAIVETVCERFATTLKVKEPGQHKVFVETTTARILNEGELDTLLPQVPHILVLPMSGDYASKRTVSHLLVPAVGRKVLDLGEDLEKAPTFKLIANSLILGNLEILA
ncbi:hypothetical protein AN958_06751, partial [Leucoagaricus sp. SymC.cos]